MTELFVLALAVLDTGSPEAQTRHMATIIPKPNGSCWCRCGLPTSPGRYFVQGHDRRAESALNAVEADQDILVRLVHAGYTFNDKNLREAALATGHFTACPEPGCAVYGRGIGMRRHVHEAHAS